MCLCTAILGDVEGPAEVLSTSPAPRAGLWEGNADTQHFHLAENTWDLAFGVEK